MKECSNPTEEGIWLSHLNQTIPELKEFRNAGAKSLKRLYNVLIEDPACDELLEIIKTNGDDLNDVEVRVREESP